MPINPNVYRDDLTSIARMLRLLGRTTAPTPGQGQQPPDPIALLDRSGQAHAFIRHCTDNARRYREVDAKTNPAAPSVAAAYIAATIHAATVNRHLAVATDLAVKCALAERGAPRSAAESLFRRRHAAATSALAEAEKEADRGHDRVLALVSHITEPPAPQQPEPAYAAAHSPAARSRR